MSSNQYTRERKEDKPVLAICYDFDKHCRQTICRHRGISNLLDMMWESFGQNQMDWRAKMIWIRIWLICF